MHFLFKLSKLDLSDPYFEFFCDHFKKLFWHYISMNQGICINFLCFGLFWPYFGPCNMYTKKIFHISMIVTIAQLAEHYSFDLEARVQILPRRE